MATTVRPSGFEVWCDECRTVIPDGKLHSEQAARIKAAAHQVGHDMHRLSSAAAKFESLASR